jgi:hypothetical protein
MMKISDSSKHIGEDTTPIYACIRASIIDKVSNLSRKVSKKGLGLLKMTLSLEITMEPHQWTTTTRTSFVHLREKTSKLLDNTKQSITETRLE